MGAEEPTMANRVQPIPEGYHTATPYLICDGAAQAIEFYKSAFGAVEIMRMPGPNVLPYEERLARGIIAGGSQNISELIATEIECYIR
jgi:glyoxalase-like protein